MRRQKVNNRRHPVAERGRALSLFNGRYLEPTQHKREFRQLLQAMNVALRDSHGGGIVERFDVISKLLFAKVFDENEVRQGVKERHDFRLDVDDTPDALFGRISAVWVRACAEHDALFHGRVADLTQDRAALFRMVGLLEGVSLVETRGDIKGLAYEELLRNTFDKNENQQFFTPHEVVEFMVQIAAPTDGEVVCDPACGTGGFLVEASRVVGDHPHLIGAEVDERLARVAQMNLVMHGADQAKVRYLPGIGSLAPLDQIAWALPAGTMDVILTNPPFGSDLTDETSLSQFDTGRGRASRRRSVLFTERCLDLLRPGGRMAIVLDESVLNLPSNADVRSMITRRAIVEAVVSLPDVAFMPYSTAKSSILLLRKKEFCERQGPIFMAEAGEVGRRPNGDPLYSDQRDEKGDRQLVNDLTPIASSYAEYRNGDSTADSRCFITEAVQLDGRLDIYYYHPKRFLAEAEIGAARFPTPPLAELVAVGRESVTPCDEFGDSPVRWLGLGDILERTGEFEVKVVPAEKIKSAAHVFRPGDILCSRLRPNLRKVVLIPDEDEGGVCSGEIIVLRALDRLPANHPKRDQNGWAVDSEFLTFMLRTDLVYGQLMYRITGVGRPRVSPEAVLSVKIPLPPLSEQRKIVAALRSQWSESVSARHEASKWLQRSTEIMSHAYEQAIRRLTSY